MALLGIWTSALWHEYSRTCSITHAVLTIDRSIDQILRPISCVGRDRRLKTCRSRPEIEIYESRPEIENLWVETGDWNLWVETGDWKCVRVSRSIDLVIDLASRRWFWHRDEIVDAGPGFKSQDGHYGILMKYIPEHWPMSLAPTIGESCSRGKKTSGKNWEQWHGVVGYTTCAKA